MIDIVVLILVSTLLVMISAYAALIMLNTKNSTGVPMIPVGVFETISIISGSQAPWFILDMARKLDAMVFQVPLPIPGGCYFVGDHELAREILKEPSTDKPPLLYRPFQLTFGPGNILSLPNNSVKHRRKGCAQAFAANEMDRMRRICHEHINRWMKETLEPLVESNTTFDPSVEMSKISIRVIAEAGFEYEIADNEIAFFIQHINAALREYGLRQMTNPARQWLGWFLPEVRNAYSSCLELQKWGRKILKAYRDNPNPSSNKTLIRIIVENPDYDNDDVRISDILTFIVAGFDTTGYSLSSALFYLAKNPSVAQRLREELRNLKSVTNGVSKNNPSGDGGGCNHNEGSSRCDLSKSPYLHQVIRENMRILPVVPLGSIRVTGRDHDVVSSAVPNKKETTNMTMKIPKGAVCFCPPILFGRNQSVFGHDTDVFDPERWTTPTKAMNDSHMMFSLGARNCIGQALATLELYAALPRLVMNHEFSMEDEGYIDYFLTMRFAGVRMKAKVVHSQE